MRNSVSIYPPIGSSDFDFQAALRADLAAAVDEDDSNSEDDEWNVIPSDVRADLAMMLLTHIGRGPYPLCIIDECPWCRELEKAYRPPCKNAPPKKKPWEHEQLLDWKCSHTDCTEDPFIACDIGGCPFLCCCRPHKSCPLHPLGINSDEYFAPEEGLGLGFKE